jgi:hypothetical protein
MELNHCIVIMADGKTHEGVITGTFNEAGGGIHLATHGNPPRPLEFSAILSITFNVKG